MVLAKSEPRVESQPRVRHALSARTGVKQREKCA
jgi:hypothetical protein